MFSKRIKAISVLMASVLLLSGCDTKLWENPPDVEAQEFAGAACLSNTGPILNHYIAGNATELEISALWECLGSAVSSFQRYVRGSEKNRYTSQEIATFLEQNYVEKKKECDYARFAAGVYEAQAVVRWGRPQLHHSKRARQNSRCFQTFENGHCPSKSLHESFGIEVESFRNQSNSK